MKSPPVILDSSALLAFMHGEAGADTVQAEMAGASISSANWAEVAQRLTAAAVDVPRMREHILALGCRIVPFDHVDAEMTGAIWPSTDQRGLSLGDRACLALGIRLGRPVYTANRGWAGLELNAEVRLIR